MKNLSPIPAALAAVCVLVCLLGVQEYRTLSRVRLAERHATKAQQVAELAHARMDCRGFHADPDRPAGRPALRVVGGAR